MPRRDDDPDETEGRALYRRQADSLAAAQMNMARRRVKLSRTAEEPAPQPQPTLAAEKTPG